MRAMERFRYGVGIAGLLIAALCVAAAPGFAQANNAKDKDSVPCTGYGECSKPPANIVGGFKDVHALPPGGPAPRLADGHVDLTGRWYPDAAGKMLQVAYPLDPAAFQQFDPKKTPEVAAVFKPGLDPKYKKPAPYGDCDQAGTPSTNLEQGSQHAPMGVDRKSAKTRLALRIPARRSHGVHESPASEGSRSYVQRGHHRALGGRHAGARRHRH
jgi:hypothetical protein